ncbi:MAG: hypothetical protein Kow0049_34990 [Stanieria sp.]
MSGAIDHSNLQIFKILVAAAWIDGSIQAEEQEHLKQVASSQNLTDEPDVQTLLAVTEPIPSEQCYQWLNDYLGSHPTESDYQNLLEAIAALVYSDDEIATEEAKLLSELQSLAPTHESSQLTFDKLLKAIGRLYRQKFR